MSALLAVTFSDPFAQIAALDDEWPKSGSSMHRENLIARARWARSYWEAANCLYGTRDVTDRIAFAGPIMQTSGLACELVLKCLLKGGGHSDKELRKIGHDLSKLFRDAEAHLDILRFLDAVARASEPIALPDEVAEKFDRLGRPPKEAEIAWRVFSQHIRILNESYDRPFRARYINEGPIALPEPFILLIGSLILLNAMNERLGLPLVGTALG